MTVIETPAEVLVAVLVILCTMLATALYQARRALTAPKRPPAAPAGDAKQSPLSVDATRVLIRSRRSIFPKDYNGKDVPRGVIEQMLEAANWAPTHGKTEPWRFVVVTGDQVPRLAALKNAENLRLLEKGSETWEYARKKIARKAKELANVSAYIAICLKRVIGKKGKPMPEWEEISSVAIAVQNMHLVATAAGVAGYWSSGGWNKALASAPIRELLGITGEGDRCLGLFHLGQSDRISRYRRTPGKWAEKVVWVDGSDEKAIVPDPEPL